MIKSATRDRAATSRHITQCAQQLTDEHGFDGFTMDELARSAGVSRRTLFNYFPSKVDAILGVWPVLDDDDVDEFRSGGPSGDLVSDLRALVLPLLTAEVSDRDALDRGRRVLLANPRLLGAAHERHEAMSTDVVEHIVAREGASFGQARARVAVLLLGSLLGAALETFLLDPRERPIAHHFDETLRTARALLGA